jgi:putative Holliday junction resolvase
VPVLSDGREGAGARKSREIIERLRREFPSLEVVGVDEAHTTDEAHERLKSAGMRAAARKPRADSIAALVILERYLAEKR